MEEFITNNLDYILGAVTAIIIPTLNHLYQFISVRIRRYKFKRFLLEEYVDPVRDEIAQKKEEHQLIDYQNELAEVTKRLTYLKEEEISFMNSDNQFYYARAIEFTKILFHALYEEAGEYEYRSMNLTEEKHQRIKEYTENKKQRMLDLIESYRNNFNKYVNLEIDELTIN